MHWNTLKIATLVALLASPSAFAAIPGAGAGAMDGRAITQEAPQPLQMADHRGGSGRWSANHRPRGAQGDRDDDRRYDRHDRRPDFRGPPPRHYRGHPHRHYRGHPPHHYRGRPHGRQFRGRPIRRFFRHWWRQY